MVSVHSEVITSKALQTDFDDTTVYTFPMKVSDVVAISYVAVRGVDEIEGAVQRPLSRRRIAEITDYVLSGKTFFNTFILNWTNTGETVEYRSGVIKIPLVPASAQIIDGQHRLAGLEDAMKENPTIGEKLLLVTMAKHLSTQKAAEIFLNINTEQKPVPKSLIFDLFGIVENDKEHALVRAKDIANELNTNKKSPYYNLIKFPGAPRGQGAIALSTVVSSFKSHLEKDSIFHRYNIKSFEMQKQIILNYFSAIYYFYDKRGIWLNKSKNPFLKSAGFTGAWDFFVEDLFSKCIDKKSFSRQTFTNYLKLDEVGLMEQEQIKGLDGKTARSKVKDYLSTNITLDIPKQNEFEL